MTSRFSGVYGLAIEEASISAAATRFARAARELTEIKGIAFTTGSEWLGELGMAVRRIRSEYVVPLELDAKLERIMGEVRRVWPTM